jgi:pimeloyl-ACP methyl ester carboxylesterase
MSNTGRRFSGQPMLRLYPTLLRRAPADRDAYVAHIERVFAAIGSRGLQRDVEDVRELALASFERDRDPRGPARQLAAIVASGDRTRELARITAPTLVIHGSLDRLVMPSGGRATARAIPGARLLMIDGMGHDLPRAAWSQLIGAIADHAHAADVARGPTPSPQTPPTSMPGLRG